MATAALETIQFPADSADTFGGSVSAAAPDGTALDVTAFAARVALVPRGGHPQDDPAEGDWRDAEWHERAGKTWADLTNDAGSALGLARGVTYAVFVGAVTPAGLVYRQAGWLKPT